MGGDAVASSQVGLSSKISIHTSVWEVTSLDDEDEDYQRISIHTSVWEVTLSIVVRGLGLLLFQSTPPYGRWRKVFWKCFGWESISIHTSVWEVTLSKYNCAGLFHLISIHTSVWEVTFQALSDWLPNKISIHTSVWEVTCMYI